MKKIEIVEKIHCGKNYGQRKLTERMKKRKKDIEIVEINRDSEK